MMEVPSAAVGQRAETPDPRPASWDDVGFVPQKAVRWFDPRVLADAALRVALTTAFGAYLDKRELQAVADVEVTRDLAERTGGVWVDYLADTGDGFDATYTMAWLASQEALTVPGAPDPLPRGDLLVLGGDEVYPTASPEDYENRLTGPFSAALPWLEPGTRPHLAALPGNHDWYDGLTSFLRTFGQHKRVGGWQTSQTRSYFAVELPHDWWLWGIDVYLDSYIDEPQLRFFEAVGLEAGDRIILCTAEPTWVDAAHDEAAYRNLAYLERKIILPAGASVRLTLSGDSHHYARYSAEDGSHKITAGGGGAFLHPTHDLPEATAVRSDPDEPSTEVAYALRETYPSRRESRRRAWGALRLPLANPSFLWVPAVIALLFLAATVQHLEEVAVGAEAAVADAQDVTLPGVLADWLTAPETGLLVLVLLGAFYGFAKPPDPLSGWRRTLARVFMAIVHSALHVVSAALLVLAGVRWGGAWLADGWWPGAVVWACVAIGGALAGGLVFGLYLALANSLGRYATHGNEAFSAQRIADRKNFLRLHVDAEGTLTVYAIGVPRACRSWRLAATDAPPSAAWIAPDGELDVQLIEEVKVS